MKKLFLILAFLTIGNLFGQGYVKPVSTHSTEFSEALSFSGTRGGGNLIFTLGDYDSSANGTFIYLNDATNEFKYSTGGQTSFSVIAEELSMLGNSSFSGEFLLRNGLDTFTLNILQNSVTANRTIEYPDASGIIALEADASGFNNNLNTGDNTLQEIAQKVDDLVLGDGSLPTSSTITTSRDALLTDLDGINISTASSDVTITINSTVSFTTGDLLLYQRQGTGNITIAYGGTYSGDTPQTYSDNQTITMRYQSTNVWNVINPPIDHNPEKFLEYAISSETVDAETGTAKLTVRAPFAFTLTNVRFSVSVAPTGSVATVDINKGGTTVLSTKLTIDVTEKTSQDALNPAVISVTAFADDVEITFDIDTVGSTITGQGYKVKLYYTRN